MTVYRVPVPKVPKPYIVIIIGTTVGGTRIDKLWWDQDLYIITYATHRGIPTTVIRKNTTFVCRVPAHMELVILVV